MDDDTGSRGTLGRREFLAASLGATAAATLPGPGVAGTAPLPRPAVFAPERAPGYYPPALTGLRGSGYESAYGVGHALRDRTFRIDEAAIVDTGEVHDLIVVGGGISGLAAAYFFRQAGTTGKHVLVLDNHDDFGGHAKRNEFRAGKRTIVSNAGTFDLSTDGSKIVEQLLRELGIDLEKLDAETVDREFYSRRGLGQGVFFDRATFGANRLVPDPSDWIEYLPLYSPTSPPDKEARWVRFMAEAPLPDRAKRDLRRLYDEEREYLPGMTPAERERFLRSITYDRFLVETAGCDPMVVTYLRDRTFGSARGLSGMSAWAARRRGMPGFKGIQATPRYPGAPAVRKPAASHGGFTTYHFPEGNATVARLLVRKLNPAALPGTTVEDSITTRVDYSKLDDGSSTARIRLNSTVVRVRHEGDGVEVVYSRGGRLYRARAARAVLACWHSVIPYICPELPAWQKEALAYAVKAPNLWVNVWLRNRRAFENAGVCFVNAPGGYYSQIILEHPVSIGAYRHAISPDEPTVLTMLRGYDRPGIPVKERYRLGRAEMYATTLEDFEREARDQLGAMLGPYGFDAAKDILGLTVNRWGHGYAYMYSNVYDEFVARGEQPPHQRARQRYGRITIANTDAAGIGSTPCAIDQAYRAVAESLAYDSLNVFY